MARVFEELRGFPGTHLEVKTAPEEANPGLKRLWEAGGRPRRKFQGPGHWRTAPFPVLTPHPRARDPGQKTALASPAGGPLHGNSQSSELVLLFAVNNNQ